MTELLQEAKVGGNGLCPCDLSFMRLQTSEPRKGFFSSKFLPFPSCSSNQIECESFGFEYVGWMIREK